MKYMKFLKVRIFRIMLAFLLLGNTFLFSKRQVSGLDYKQMSLPIHDSYFESTSTSNGRRRFLAIGNFYDTTNNAYYMNSNSVIKYIMTADRNILVNKAELRLYKYANAYYEDAEVRLRNNLDKNEIRLHVDNGDYDFDELVFDVTDTFKSAYGEEINLYLDVEDPDYKEGIAVCSGRYADSLCQTRYFPKLEITYVYNTKGKLEQFKYDEMVRFNAIYRSENVECGENSGCQYLVRFKYEDQENNAALYLKVKNNKDENIIKKQLDSTSQEIVLELEDGDYELSYKIRDGAYTVKNNFTNFQIDTTPPKAPVVLHHSEFGARSGIYIDLLDQNEKDVTFEVNLYNDENYTKLLSSQSKSEINLKFTSENPLKNNKEYYYRVVAIDDFENRSQEARFSAVQKNDLLELQTVDLSEYKISPQNKDGKFDQAELSYKANEEIFNKRLVIRNSMFKEVLTIAKEKLIFDGFDGKDFYKDGLYYLQLEANDSYGYKIADHRRLKLIIDNTPPSLF